MYVCMHVRMCMYAFFYIYLFNYSFICLFLYVLICLSSIYSFIISICLSVYSNRLRFIYLVILVRLFTFDYFFVYFISFIFTYSAMCLFVYLFPLLLCCCCKPYLLLGFFPFRQYLQKRMTTMTMIRPPSTPASRMMKVMKEDTVASPPPE